MGAAPRWKVYTPEGEYEAATKHLESAAMLVALMGDGATIRDGHGPRTIVWTEGREDFSAHESYDGCADVCSVRAGALMAASLRARVGEYPVAAR